MRPQIKLSPKFISLLLATLLLSWASCTDIHIRRKKQGVVLFRIPPKASVFLDGKMIGIGADVNRRPIELTPGLHKLVIVEPDHYNYYSTFRLKSGELLRRRVIVHRRLDE